MNKGILLLTKAENKEDAKIIVHIFLKDYFMEAYIGYEITHRWFKVKNEKEENDDLEVTKLKNCLKYAKKIQQTIKDGKKEEKKARKFLKKTKNYFVYGYMLKKAANIYEQNFFFEGNLFNIDYNDYSIPESNIEDWYVVSVNLYF